MNSAMHQKNRGIVLFGVLIILLSLTLVAVTVARRNTMDEMMAANLRDAVKAMTISESGIETGFALVKNNHVHGQVIRDDLFSLPGNILSSDSVSGGNYLVTVIDGVPNDGLFTLNSVGNINGGVREIEIMLTMRHPGRAAYAILTDDDIISIDGSPEILGPFADVHSNSNIDIQGSPEVSGTVSASGDINISGSPTIDGGTLDGAALVEIPHVFPPDYKQYANVILTADCKVTSASGVQWADVSGGGKWHGWACTPGDAWTISGSVQPDGFYDGFYYVHGNVNLGGGPVGLWLVSIVAEGYIDVAGNSIFRPWASQLPNDTGDAVANDVLFLAGNDLRVEGNPGSEFHGIMAAHMEVGIAGNATLNGSILAENGHHSMGQEVNGGQAVQNLINTNYFTGSLTMTASGSGIGAVKKLTVIAWRELIH